MIIFDLDGTLADCDHRRYHVDPSKRSDCYYHSLSNLKQMQGWYYLDDVSYPKSRVKFKPDYEKFYGACDQDEPIEYVCEIMRIYAFHKREFEIWSGRCESVIEKTIDWLHEHTGLDFYSDGLCPNLKMRPTGNSDPDEVLKEKWLDEELAKGKKIDFVFDDRPKVIRMWRRRGIFVFNCCQHEREF